MKRRNCTFYNHRKLEQTVIYDEYIEISYQMYIVGRKTDLTVSMTNSDGESSLG